MSKKDQLTKLISERDKYLKEINTKVFDMCKVATTIIEEYLIEIGEHFKGETIDWRYCFVDEIQPNSIVLIAWQELKEGTVVKDLKGETLTVTKELVPYYTRHIGNSLPYELAVSSNRDAILKHLRDVDTQNRSEEAESLLSVFKGELSEGEHDFDYGSLTDEQKRSFVNPNQTKKSKKNGAIN